LVNASRTTRCTARRVRGSASCRSSPDQSSEAVIPAATDESTSAVMSERVPVSSSSDSGSGFVRSTPRISRSSAIASDDVVRISSACSCSCGAFVAVASSSAPAWMEIRLSRWPSMSCISPAMWARSSERADAAVSARARSRYSLRSCSNRTMGRRRPSSMPDTAGKSTKNTELMAVPVTDSQSGMVRKLSCSWLNPVCSTVMMPSSAHNRPSRVMRRDAVKTTNVVMACAQRLFTAKSGAVSSSAHSGLRGASHTRAAIHSAVAMVSNGCGIGASGAIRGTSPTRKASDGQTYLTG
jgi:hypothetical protein